MKSAENNFPSTSIIWHFVLSLKILKNYIQVVGEHNKTLIVLRALTGLQGKLKKNRRGKKIYFFKLKVKECP